VRLTETFEKAIENKTRRVVGTSSVFLDGVDVVCRHRECNMGNFVTDSFVNYVSVVGDASANKTNNASSLCVYVKNI